MTETNKVYSSGKRKTAVAKATIYPGNGKVLINNKSYLGFDIFNRLRIAEPIRIAEQILGKIEFNAKINVHGGGEKGQIEAARLALARGILKFSNSRELEKTYLDYDRNILVADVRRKEAYKPGDSKARAKRQTSYR
ncbi:MAG: 30S ribosomal protein S9 [Candidatus Pacearchaeota archaeon]|jgi:small subunit ribosomal protein S9